MIIYYNTLARIYFELFLIFHIVQSELTINYVGLIQVNKGLYYGHNCLMRNDCCCASVDKWLG